MVTELIQKYVYLIQILLDAGDRGLNLEQIRTRWYRRFGEDYPRRSFNNHREAVADIFGMQIECRRSTNCYYIPYGDDATSENDSLAWMVNTFTVNNLLSLSKERLSGRIQVENIPSGQVHLTAIMSAMTEERALKIEYKKYQSPEADLLHVKPYGLKEYQKRWYMVASCDERNGALRMYSLDRIVSLEPTDVLFSVPREFNMEELFYNSFGPYIPSADAKAVTVKLRTDPSQANYFRDLPFHQSQKEERGAEGSIFTYRLIPNEDFMMELLRFTGKVEVLEPQEIREEIQNRIKQSIYDQNN